MSQSNTLDSLTGYLLCIVQLQVHIHICTLYLNSIRKTHKASIQTDRQTDRGSGMKKREMRRKETRCDATRRTQLEAPFARWQ